MGVTNFPDGVNVGSNAGGTAEFTLGGVAVTSTAAELNKLDGAAGNSLGYATAGKKVAMGTVVVPVGASGTVFASGLTTIDYVDCSPYATVVTVAGFVGAVASASAGTVTLIGISGAGTVSTSSGTATWIAIGS